MPRFSEWSIVDAKTVGAKAEDAKAVDFSTIDGEEFVDLHYFYDERQTIPS